MKQPRNAQHTTNEGEIQDSAIPREMREAQRWLVHRNKRPFYASGKARRGTLDSEKDTRQLATYADACAALASGDYTGLGFALGAGWQGVDLDGVRDPASGALVDWAQDIVDKSLAAGTYVEISLSGAGVHIIGRGDPVPTLGPNGSHVECYCTGRYFTVTGQAYTAPPARVKSIKPVLKLVQTRHGIMDMPNVPMERRGVPPIPLGVTPITWPGDRDDALRALKNISPDLGYQEWVTVGMALHHASSGTPEGFAIWDTWSRTGTKYREGDCEIRWRGFGRQKSRHPVTMASLVKLGYEGRDPVPSESEATQEPLAPRAEGTVPEVPFKIMTGDELMGTDFEAPELIFDGRIQIAPGAHLLTGKPKRGKSWLAMGLAVAAVTGEEYLGTRVTQPIQAVYLACDDPSQERFSRRLKAFRPAQKPSGLALVTDMDTEAASALEILSDIITAQPRVRFVVIDTLSAYRDARRSEAVYQQEYDELKAINDWAHHHRVVVLIVHHLRKGEVSPDDPFESISGTLGLQGAVDGMIVMERHDLQNDFDEALSEKLAGFWAKSRDVEEYSFGMRLADGRWHIAGTVSDVFGAAVRRAILEVLIANPNQWLSSKQIHAMGDFDVGAGTVQRACSRMAKRGEIEVHRGAFDGQKGGGGGYRLKSV